MSETPCLKPIHNGWAAYGDGWAVHGATEAEASQKFREADLKHQEIMARPEPAAAPSTVPGVEE